MKKITTVLTLVGACALMTACADSSREQIDAANTKAADAAQRADAAARSAQEAAAAAQAAEAKVAAMTSSKMRK